jgi:hypothetical protein
LLGLRLGGLEFAEKGIQTLEVVFPKTAITFQPHLQLLEGSRAQSIDAALGVRANMNETGIAEDAEMLGDLRLAQAEPADEVADGAGTAAQEFDDMKAVGLGQRTKGLHHGRGEYASGRIFLSRYILAEEYTNRVFHRYEEKSASKEMD